MWSGSFEMAAPGFAFRQKLRSGRIGSGVRPLCRGEVAVERSAARHLFEELRP